MCDIYKFRITWDSIQIEAELLSCFILLFILKGQSLFDEICIFCSLTPWWSSLAPNRRDPLRKNVICEHCSRLISSNISKFLWKTCCCCQKKRNNHSISNANYFSDKNDDNRTIEYRSKVLNKLNTYNQYNKTEQLWDIIKSIFIHFYNPFSLTFYRLWVTWASAVDLFQFP